MGYLALTASPEERNSATSALMSFLTDTSYEVRRDAVEGIVRVGAVSEATTTLKEMAQADKDPWVKESAKWALRKGDNPRR